MSRRQVQRRILADLAEHLADSDPRLDELFFSFNLHASGRRIPSTERIRTGPLGWLAKFRVQVRPTAGDFDRTSAWWL